MPPGAVALHFGAPVAPALRPRRRSGQPVGAVRTAFLRRAAADKLLIGGFVEDDPHLAALASFSNWRVRYQPCASASSAAFRYKPMPFSAREVSTTLAPSIRISWRRSIEKLSAFVTTIG